MFRNKEVQKYATCLTLWKVRSFIKTFICGFYIITENEDIILDILIKQLCVYIYLFL